MFSGEGVNKLRDHLHKAYPTPPRSESDFDPLHYDDADHPISQQGTLHPLVAHQGPQVADAHQPLTGQLPPAPPTHLNYQIPPGPPWPPTQFYHSQNFPPAPESLDDEPMGDGDN